jgi:GTP cyclohydrolase II
VKRLRLLTSHPRKRAGRGGFGLELDDYVPLEAPSDAADASDTGGASVYDPRRPWG